MKITYDAYDKVVEICEKMVEMSQGATENDKDVYIGSMWFPTVADLKSANVEDEFKKYFTFLMYFYTTRFEIDDPELRTSYEEMKAYVKRVVDSHIVFSD